VQIEFSNEPSIRLSRSDFDRVDKDRRLVLRNGNRAKYFVLQIFLSDNRKVWRRIKFK